MPCFVYASLRKPDTYLWLARRDDFEAMPATLVQLLGELRFVMEVDLHDGRRLPREDVVQVMENLRQQGWHLQLPPGESVTVPPPPSSAP